MIELNLTYEESKKIRELGYDFSAVCTKFECREMVMNNEEATTLTFLYSCGEIMTMWNPRMSEPYSYHLKSSPASGIIPLIPKAALEKCLPLIDGVIWKRFPAAGDGLLRCTGLNHRTVETCTGFHEFLWCHENYPEELKKNLIMR